MAKTTKKTTSFTILGKKVNKPIKKLEVFPNQAVGRYYLISLKTEEFTCLCPVTGQPDFARISIYYVPDKNIVESKSLKLYLWSFRNQGTFHEHLVNTILDDLIAVLNPHWCLVNGDFNIRGGIGISVQAEHIKTPEAQSLWKDRYRRIDS